MFCDYPLDNDSTLEINLTHNKDFNNVLSNSNDPN